MQLVLKKALLFLSFMLRITSFRALKQNMRTLLIVIFFLMTAISYGQMPVIEKVTSEICDTLSKIEKPLEELSYEESKNIIRTVLIKNYSDWLTELSEFRKKTGKTNTAEYDFDQYFHHVLQMDCQSFRIIDKKLDTYLFDMENLRPLYLRTKEFIIALEDQFKDIDLKQFLCDSLNNENLSGLLNRSRIEVTKCKRTTTLSIILVFVDDYTFRARYFDYLTDEPEFQIDLIFKDDSDLQIDNLIIKDKTQLMLELEERIEFNKKVKSGEIELPPPQPPPTPKKN